MKKAIYKTFNKKHVYSLRMRLFLSFITLIAVMLVCILPIFYVFDIFDAPKRKISEALDNYLVNYEKSIDYQFDTIAAYGIQLNTKITDEIEKILRENNIQSFEDVKDNKKAITMLEERTSKILRASLLISKSSGAFVALNTTINSATNNKEQTCSGVYIKISNINNNNDINPAMFLLRGIPSIADYNNIELHNKWEMEFDRTECMPHTFEQDYTHIPFNERYFFLEPYFIKDTWEKVILLVTPLVGANGKVYGLCGLEISALLYNLSHGHINPSLGGIAGLIALERKQNDESLFYFDKNFSHSNGFLRAESYTQKPQTNGDFYSLFMNNDEAYIGKIFEFTPSAMDMHNGKTLWHIAALMPKELEEQRVFRNNLFIFLPVVIFSGIAVVISFILMHRFSAPITKSLQKIRNNTQNSAEINVEIREFNDLIAHIRNKEKALMQQMLERQNASTESPLVFENGSDDQAADVTAYHAFIEQLDTLTKSERKVFELYMQKFSSHDVAKKLEVSINTVRTHNRNIYSKLYVSSYKELMVYIQMMVGNANGSEKK